MKTSIDSNALKALKIELQASFIKVWGEEGLNDFNTYIKNTNVKICQYWKRFFQKLSEDYINLVKNLEAMKVGLNWDYFRVIIEHNAFIFKVLDTLNSNWGTINHHPDLFEEIQHIKEPKKLNIFEAKLQEIRAALPNAQKPITNDTTRATGSSPFKTSGDVTLYFSTPDNADNMFPLSLSNPISSSATPSHHFAQGMQPHSSSSSNSSSSSKPNFKSTPSNAKSNLDYPSCMKSEDENEDQDNNSLEFLTFLTPEQQVSLHNPHYSSTSTALLPTPPSPSTKASSSTNSQPIKPLHISPARPNTASELDSSTSFSASSSSSVSKPRIFSKKHNVNIKPPFFKQSNLGTQGCEAEVTDSNGVKKKKKVIFKL